MSLPRLLPLFSLLFASALAWPAVPVGAAEEEDDDVRPSISVTGTGRVQAAPDVAEISVGVQTLRPTAQAALAANNELMAALIATLEGGGIAKKDIQTSNINVAPQFSQPQPRPGFPQGAENEPPQIVGYTVSNTVTITVRKIDALGTLLDQVVRAGANQIYGIRFTIDRQDELLDQARAKAVADARRKAELLAKEAGAGLGPVRQISESSGEMPQPMFRGRMMAMAAPAAVPVAAGEQELSVTVAIVYDLKPQP